MALLPLQDLRLTIGSWSVAACARIFSRAKVLLSAHLDPVVYFRDLAPLLLHDVLIELIQILESEIVSSLILLEIIRILFVQLNVRYQGYLLRVTEVVDVLDDLVVVDQVLILEEVLAKELLRLALGVSLKAILFPLKVTLLLRFLKVVKRLEFLVLAISRPRSFWHRRVDLLQIELVLNCFLVDIRDHVRRLHEWHGERRSHHNIEAAFTLWGCKVHLDWIKILTKPPFCLKRLNDDCVLAIFL